MQQNINKYKQNIEKWLKEEWDKIELLEEKHGHLNIHRKREKLHVGSNQQLSVGESTTKSIGTIKHNKY